MTDNYTMLCGCVVEIDLEDAAEYALNESGLVEYTEVGAVRMVQPCNEHGGKT